MSKICIHCKVEKELKDYYKCKNCKDGHRNTCKKCTMENNKELYKRHLDISEERICAGCNILKPITKFKRKNGVRENTCRACVTGPTNPTNYWPTEKQCRCCLEVKPIDRFRKNSPSKNGVRYYTNICKPCDNRNRNLRRAGKPKMKAKLQRSRVKYKYGLTMDEINQMIENQGNKCKICDNIFEKLVIDHDHKSGKVRGMLCAGCNSGLGFFKDNIENFKSAIKYLEDNTAL
jgi:hypothetical protein